jgi:SAM-dependent methyltransferase
MTVNASRYIHGSDEIEQRRLTALNRWINERILPAMRLGSQGGERIIDFGAGLGQFTRMLAKASGSTQRVVGIERDPNQIAEAMRQARNATEDHLIDLRQGDVVNAPPLSTDEWGTFDFAHARFILEHVPDPLAVVKNMVRSVRSGGRITLADDDHEILRLWPEIPAFDRAWRAYQQTYVAAGNDPIVGRRLIELLHAAGAKPVRNAWVFFGSCAGEAIWPTVIENCIVILRGAREAMLRLPEASDAMIEEAIDALRAWSARPDAALWYAIALAEGVKP